MYWQYFRAGGGCLSSFFLLVTFLITHILFSGSEYWLTLWTNSEERRAHFNWTISENSTESGESDQLHNNETASSIAQSLDNIDTYMGITVFSGMVAGVFVFSLVRTIHFFILCMNSSVGLHNKMFQAIIRAPLQFFDHNPVGNNCCKHKFNRIL